MRNLLHTAPWGATEYAALVVGLVPGWLVAVFLHEAGHAVFARLAGVGVSSFGIGIRQPFLSVRFRGCRIYLARGLFRGGLAFLFSRRWATPRWRYAVAIAGGAITNLCLAAAATLVARSCDGPAAITVYVFAAINALLGVCSLVPSTTQVGSTQVMSDGGLIRDTLVSPDFDQSCQAVRATRTGLAVWDELLERRVAAVYLDTCALVWAWLGDSTAAEAAILSGDERRDRDAGPFERGLAAFTLGVVCRAKACYPEADTFFVEADRLFSEADDVAARLIATAMRAEAMSAAGDIQSALALLEMCNASAEVQHIRTARTWQSLVRLVNLRLAASESCSEVDIVESLSGDFAFDAWVCRLAAAEYVARNPERSIAALRAAAANTVRAARYFDHPEDRLRHVELADRAILAYRRAAAERGLPVSELTRDLLGPLYAESVRLELVSGGPDADREGRRLLLGLVAWLLAVASCVVMGLGVSVLRNGTHGEKWAAASLGFGLIFGGLFYAVAIAFTAVSVLVRLWRPTADPRYGTRMLLLVGIGVATSAIVTVGLWLTGP